MAALAFVFGGVAVYTYSPSLWAAALAFFFHLGREIIKDMEDELASAEKILLNATEREQMKIIRSNLPEWADRNRKAVDLARAQYPARRFEIGLTYNAGL